MGPRPWAPLVVAVVLAGCMEAAPQEAEVFVAEAAAAGAESNHPVGDGRDQPPLTGFSLHLLAEGLGALTQAVDAADGSGRVFLVERAGLVRTLTRNGLHDEPFLDLAARVSSGDGERGLLSLAVAPDFHRSGIVFVTYTDHSGDSVVARVRPSVAGDPAVTVLLRIEQPTSVHNANHVAFGLDRLLYVAVGDGGATGADAQDLRSLRGAILRLDVTPEGSYEVPPTNPFRDSADARPEIWASGLRNPWRLAFDPPTGNLWVSDVGERDWEEINLVRPGDRAGRNFGWEAYEGFHLRAGFDPVDGVTFPVWSYGHEGGHCAIIGGVVYRGKSLPELEGAYLFSDYCSGMVAALASEGDQRVLRRLDVTLRGVTSFGEDAGGEVLLVTERGTVHRLVSA